MQDASTESQIDDSYYFRHKDDPGFLERKRQRERDWYHIKKHDPEWVEKKRKSIRNAIKNRSPEQIKNIKENTLKYNRGKGYNAVKSARAKRRQHIIDLLGGGCSKCGYNKYIGALDLHETEKIFHPSPNKCLRTKTGYQLVLDNLGKIVLLCSNCHKEYHAGLIELPVKPSTNNQK